MTEKVKTKFISIQQEALLSSKLKSIDKFVLLILGDRKLIGTKNGSWYTIEIRANKLKQLTFINDHRTLMRSLDRLKENGYIKFDFKRFNSHGKSSIYIDEGKIFTMVDEERFESLVKLDTGEKKPYQIVILYYLLENYYNPTHGYGMSSPSREMIFESLRINGAILTKYFKLMHKEKICEFFQGEFIDGYRRVRNRFIPNTIKYKVGEENIGDGKRRYVNHKQRSYFIGD